MSETKDNLRNEVLHNEIERLRASNKELVGLLEAVLPVLEKATFEAGPDECDTGLALTSAIDAEIMADKIRAAIAKAKGEK
jgi:hypothetical protein